MDASTVIQSLQAKGKPKTARVYLRHGVGEPAFGVSYADLTAMVKRLGTNHALARQLWQSGIHDARVLATKVANPAEMKEEELQAWLREANNYIIIEALGGLAARMPRAKELALSWIDDKGEWASSAGWTVLSLLSFEGGLRPAEASSLIARIRKGIAKAPNRTRHTMNAALIAIGGSHDGLRAQAIEVARAVGPVEVEHGETGCETPDAAEYIEKMSSGQGGKVKASSPSKAGSASKGGGAREAGSAGKAGSASKAGSAGSGGKGGSAGSGRKTGSASKTGSAGKPGSSGKAGSGGKAGSAGSASAVKMRKAGGANNGRKVAAQPSSPARSPAKSLRAASHRSGAARSTAKVDTETLKLVSTTRGTSRSTARGAKTDTTKGVAAEANGAGKKVRSGPAKRK